MNNDQPIMLDEVESSVATAGAVRIKLTAEHMQTLQQGVMLRFRTYDGYITIYLTPPAVEPRDS